MPDTVRGVEGDLQNGPMLAADGTPLKRSLHRALRRQKLRALALIAPLLLFILISFVGPIADMLFRSVENEIVANTLPRTVQALEDWRYASGEVPSEDVFAALYIDLAEAREFKIHTRLGSRLNYEITGASSLFRRTGRGLGRMDTDIYREQFAELDPAWENPVVWVKAFGGAGPQRFFPRRRPPGRVGNEFSWPTERSRIRNRPTISSTRCSIGIWHGMRERFPPTPAPLPMSCGRRQPRCPASRPYP